MHKGKGRTVNRAQKRSEARESPQRVEEEPEGLELCPQQERGSGGCTEAVVAEFSIADLLRRLKLAEVPQGLKTARLIFLAST
jgi:hypothetical protein